MISVVMATLNDERTLADALAALVPAAVDGLVKEVILADGGSVDATLPIAEDAGATVLHVPSCRGARLLVACVMARASWLLILPARRCLTHEWEDAVRRHIEESDEKVSAEVAPAHGALLPWRHREGVLVAAKQYASVGGFREVDAPEADLMRRLWGSGLRRLRIGL
jgi:hypothetical protein